MPASNSSARTAERRACGSESRQKEDPENRKDLPRRLGNIRANEIACRWGGEAGAIN
jgi:hypothetical protein